MDTAKTMLWATGGMMLLMAMTKLAIPALNDNVYLASAQLFCFGSLVAIGVWMSIVRMGDKSRPDNYSMDAKGIKFLPPEKVYKSQKIAAIVICIFILAPFLATTVYLGRFAEFGGWLLLPITGIGPTLFLRDYFSREKARR
ncbi:MAG: hypothetical protein OEZ04_11150 [Nitrospinota bacterium]|nr:hypothetical protein [Nitrospinota bacterium]